MIYTSYFANIKNLPPNFIPISICARPPIGYKGLEYKKLAPKWNIVSNFKEDNNEDLAKEKYQKEILDKLNMNVVYKELQNMLPKEKQENCTIVLICYESPEKFCHRKLVAKEFQKYGIKCEEYMENQQLWLFDL